MALVAVGCALASGLSLPWWGTRVDTADPSDKMTQHSEQFLNQSREADVASVAALQEKLQLKKMTIDLDTQVFTASRGAAKGNINMMCGLPEGVCKSMMQALDNRKIVYHKKSSTPLDENQGSFHAVWMWVQETGRHDEVQVAFKTMSLSYQLRDVVEYAEQVEDEPVVKCETTVTWSGSSEKCREIARKKTVVPIPVFKAAIMSPKEMQLVDTMMEGMLAKKVLENAGAAIPLPAASSVPVRPHGSQ